MGGIDAYTYIEHDAVFASAQTGNMVVFAVKMFNGGINQAWGNIPVWIGFAFGCFTAQGLITHLKSNLTSKQYYTLAMFMTTAVLLVCAILQSTMNSLLLILILGWLSGYELTTFRKVGDQSVNNGIMTGNTKNLMVTAYQALIEHDQDARHKSFVITLILLTFIAGAYSSALLCTTIATILPLWLAASLNILGLVSVLVTAPNQKVTEIKRNKKAIR